MSAGRTTEASRRLRVAAFVVGVGLASTAAAETLFITDRVEVGLHGEASPQSEILELLPSGTEVTVLERDDGAVRVQLEDGRAGWVDPRFLVPAPPAAIALDEARAELARANDALAASTARLEETETRVHELELARGDAESRLADAETRAGVLTAALDQARREAEEATRSADAGARAAEIRAAERDALAARAADAEQVASEAAARVASLESELEAATTALAAARANAASEANARIAVLEASLAERTAGLGEARSKLAAETERADSAEWALATTTRALETARSQAEAQPAPAPVASETLREMQRLAEENQRLKQGLAESDAVRAMLTERLGKAGEDVSAPARSPPGTARGAGARARQAQWERHLPWYTLMAGAILLLAFSVGAYFMDWVNRRRHGGVRV